MVRWRQILPWAIGLITLTFVILVVLRRGDIERFAELARAARPIWLLLACLAQTGTYLCAAGVWHRALLHSGHRKSLATLVPLGVAKLFTDQALPSGGISGTALVVHGLVRRSIAANTAMAALLVGLVSFYTAYVIAALASLAILWVHHRANLLFLGLVTILTVVAVAIPASVLGLRQWASRPVPGWLYRIAALKDMLKAMADAPGDLIRSPRLIAEAVILQLAVFCLDALTLWLAFRSIGESVPFWIVFVSFVIASVSATVSPAPLSVGTFEGGCVATLRFLGISLEPALTATLLLRGLTFWLPMLPGLWLARRELGDG